VPLFQIETYKVSSYLERFTGETRPSRVLEMTGPVLYHGIQNRASFAFSSFFDGVWGSPVAGYLTDGGFSGLSVVGWFPVAEFSYYYDILRSERPVHVLYEFRDAGASSGYLRRVGLGTSTEPIGEGPSESLERLSAILAEHLTAVPGRMVPMPIEADLRKGSK
jgi:hypothetical protein